jgi:D-glycero-D-manno-heptose 1,7-bisphosphate phosphatase
MGIDDPLTRAVFLDRDGVLNRPIIRNGRPYPPSSISELEILPGVREALARLKRAKFRLIVVTNQPDVARGTQTRKEIEAMNAVLGRQLGLDTFLVCYHDDVDRCECRKPAPGLLTAAAKKERLDLKGSFIVGDRWRDIEAGRRAGCIPIFIDYGYIENPPVDCAITVKSLAEAAHYICSMKGVEK